MLQHKESVFSKFGVEETVTYLSNIPIQWHSKWKAITEFPTYGPEMTAAKTKTEMARSMRYELCMLGGPIQKPTITFGDDQWMMTDCSPFTNILKWHHASTYHKVRGAATAGVTNFVHDDVADVFTKPLSPQQYYLLLSRFLVLGCQVHCMT